MKKISIYSFLLFILWSCSNSTDQPAAEDKPVQDDLNVATEFIRSALDGNYDKAKKLVVPDSINLQTLDFYETNYNQRMTPDDKRGYRESSIRILETKSINDSVSVVKYANSYKNIPDSLKVIRVNGKWLIDMGYRFNQPDSTNK